MKTGNSGWKKEPGNSGITYRFSPPSNWSAKRIKEELLLIVNRVDKLSIDDNADLAELPCLINKIPDELRAALRSELQAGNRIASVMSIGWPQTGSVVVEVENRFSVARHSKSDKVIWSKVSAPQYWREDLSQKVGETDFLILT